MYTVHTRHLVKKHIKNLKSARLYKTYCKIMDELKTDPLIRTHSFEILEKRSPKPNIYSKRISQSNRIVYNVDRENRTVTVFSAWGHYASGNQSMIHHKM
ncbi:type II toxin-antitoxin system YoeB family toxin [Lactobacillus sp.]|uniref:type II toxin-antitoxin system YoeB family toxin n=1 Tax=Lactobacillus sp. TaxID=1591 RepID=UPI0019A934E8|nr:type II toxin-antitoxin system YoeB family toxin [Lactobacillus sp.]MBD5429533.1 hypothetical protein [Lactobacillus sp.]